MGADNVRCKGWGGVMVSGFAEGFMWINRNPGSSNIYINQWLTIEKHKRVIFRVIEKQLHISTVWYFEQCNCLDFFILRREK
jgi:hypothetical protein